MKVLNETQQNYEYTGEQSIDDKSQPDVVSFMQQDATGSDTVADE